MYFGVKKKRLSKKKGTGDEAKGEKSGTGEGDKAVPICTSCSLVPMQAFLDPPLIIMYNEGGKWHGDKKAISMIRRGWIQNPHKGGSFLSLEHAHF